MASQSDLNETLRKISNSLENALDTFGPASRQYQTILEILKDCLRDLENSEKTAVVDQDMLAAAMDFLNIGK